MDFASARYVLTSFDGGTKLKATIRQPDKYRFFDQLHDGDLIPRGAGLSYPAASFGPTGTAVDCSAFNRFLSYEDGILNVEAGVTLGQLYNFLIKRGRYISVQPGHPDITVGGCVAADVHGKNQLHDGTFSSLVKAIELFHPKHGFTKLSRTQNAELFDLTCGGYGLTGIMTAVSLQTKSIPSPHVEIITIPVPAVEDVEAIMKEYVNQYDLIYSWHDFTTKGDKFGRGFIKAARFLTSDRACSDLDQRDRHPRRTLYSERRGDYRLSFFSPSRTLPFNRLYYLEEMLHPSVRKMELYDFLFPVHDKEIYFKLFGSRGFHECQYIIPSDAYGQWLESVKAYLSRHPIPVALASAKLFAGEKHLLRFTGNGVCMALDFPRSDRSLQFVEFINNLAIISGAIPNIIKDSHLSARVVSACYPEYESFRSRLRAFDPDRLFRSDLSERLGL
jgi:decaprenylphospho-beta-D-ribofuranose 2-oxidase